MNQQQCASELLKKREAAAMLRVGLRTLDTWISRQTIPFVKIGRAVRFLRTDIEAFIQKHRIGRAA